MSFGEWWAVATRTTCSVSAEEPGLYARVRPLTALLLPLMLQWFDTKRPESFGEKLARDLLAQLEGSFSKHDAKFKAKVEKALVRADGQIRQFCGTEKMNFYKRSKLANAFLWTLKDAGCPEDYAQELTHWLTMRL